MTDKKAPAQTPVATYVSPNTPDTPSAISKNSENILAVLKPLCDGLLYLSESDRPVTPFFWQASELNGVFAGATDGLSPLTLFAAGKAPEGASITHQTIAQVLGSQTEEKEWFGPEEKARAKRFQKLQAVLEDHLTDLTAFRVGETEIALYIMGKTKEGDVAGVETVAVET
jgi:hypothetical protein